MHRIRGARLLIHAHPVANLNLLIRKNRAQLFVGDGLLLAVLVIRPLERGGAADDPRVVARDENGVDDFIVVVTGGFPFRVGAFDLHFLSYVP